MSKLIEDGKLIEDEQKCVRCGNPVTEGYHRCPYQADVEDNDDPDYCNCCDTCTDECAADI